MGFGRDCVGAKGFNDLLLIFNVPDATVFPAAVETRHKQVFPFAEEVAAFMSITSHPFFSRLRRTQPVPNGCFIGSGNASERAVPTPESESRE